jgi:hypothetical protein
MMMKDDPAAAAMARFKTAMQALPFFEVQVDATDKRSLKLTADFIIDGRKRLLYDAMTPVGRYILTITPERYREVDYASKSYEEAVSPGPVWQVESRFSNIPKTIPFWLKAGDIQSLLPKGAKAVYVGKQTVSGIACDLIRTTYKNQFGSGTMEFCIADSGLAYRYFSEFNGIEGHKAFEWVLRAYKPLTTISAARFENRIPDGFMPYSLPDRDIPTEIGKKPNLRGWVNPLTGAAWSPPSGRALLFVFADRSSMPCRRALKALDGWRDELKAKNVDVAVASDAAAAADSGRMLFDPDGKSLSLLDPPAAPMIYLVDKGGTLRNLWMGFGPDRAKRLHDEIIKAIAALK